MVGSTPTVLFPSDCSAALANIRHETSHICGYLPVLPGWNIFYALLQEMPVGVELLRSLIKVASIGSKGCFVQGDYSCACGSSKARNVF